MRGLVQRFAVIASLVIGRAPSAQQAVRPRDNQFNAVVSLPLQDFRIRQVNGTERTRRTPSRQIGPSDLEVQLFEPPPCVSGV